MRRKHRIRGTTQIAFIKMPLKSLTQIYGQGYCQFTLPAQKLPSHTLSVSFHPPDTLCKKQVHYSSFSKPFHIEFILTKNNLIVKPSIGTITKQHHSDVLFSSLIYFTNKKGTVKNCSFFIGAEGETRTLAPVARPTPLAGAPRHQLEYFCKLTGYTCQVFIALHLSCELYFNTRYSKCQ